MDWSKAKTILIIAFACLNILLGYQLWASWDGEHENGVANSQMAQELDQLLQARNIHLAGPLSDDGQKMGYLHVRVEQMDRSWKRLSKPVALDRDVESVIDALRAQLREIAAYEWDSESSRRDTWVFYQMVDQFPVYVATFEVKREGDQLTAYRRVKVDVEEKEKATSVISPHAALKSAVEREHIPPNATVTDVRPGYAGPLGNEKEQLLIPVWRITVDGADSVFVNALTGSVETNVGEKGEERENAF